MNQEQEELVKRIFVAALQEQEGPQRDAYLAQACGPDRQLRQRLEELLDERQKAGTPGEESVAAAPVSTVAVRPQVTEKPGDTIANYKLLQQIGEGGCGVVYMAEQEEPIRRRVALKVIKLGMDTKQVIARFEAERQALALMGHPNIAKVLDAGTTDTGRPYFVMELVRGIKITDYCDQHNLSTRERLKLFIEVCRAVQHAHQKGIIHRDIKPSNILVTLHDGVPVPKVIDFGIAKATEGRLTDATVYTQLHQIIGTPAYMSPEQAEMSGLDVDTRSDIYSLGVLLYELLTGRTPFDAQELMSAGIDAMRRRIRETEPPRPSTRLATLKPEELTRTAKRRSTEVPRLISLLKGDLDWVVMKCLEKDRTWRYGTANGLATDLQRHLSQEPVLARPPSRVYRLRKFVRRNRAMVTAAAAFVAVLLLGVMVTTWEAVRASRLRLKAEANEQKAVLAGANEARLRRAAELAQRQAEAEKLLARQEAYAADMNLAQEALAANDLGRARGWLEGHQPRAGEPDLRGWEWRYLRQACRSDVLHELCRYSNSVYSVAYGPNGRVLAVAGLVQEFVDLWDAATRRRIARLQEGRGHLVAFAPVGDLLATEADGEIRLWRVGATNIVGRMAVAGAVVRVRFSPDATRLASLSATGEVTVWDVEQKTALRRIPGARTLGLHLAALDFSPDGNTLMLGVADGQVHGQLCAFDLGTGNTKFIVPEAHPEPITAVAWSPKGDVIVSGSGYSGGPIRLWDSASGKSLGALEGHTAWISELIFSADGKRLYSASADQTIRIWDVAQRRCMATLRGSSDEVYGLALSPDGTTLASGTKDGVVAFWNALPRPEEETPRLIPWDGYGLPAFSPDSRFLAAPRAGTVSLIDLATAREIETLPALGTNAVVVAYSPDGSLLVSGAQDGTIRVWSFAERRLLGPVNGHDAAIRFLQFRADGARLGSFDARGKAIWWNTHTWQQACRSFALEGIQSGAVSPDGQLIAGGAAGGLHWLNAETGERLAGSPGHRHGVAGVAFSRDGSQVASVAEDGTVALWDASSFKPITIFRGHMHGAHSVAFSPDGRRLATGGGTGRDAVKLWDFSTHRELMTLSGKGSVFYFVAFSADGRWLAACDWIGKRLHLWQAPSWAEVESLEKGRALGP